MVDAVLLPITFYAVRVLLVYYSEMSGPCLLLYIIHTNVYLNAHVSFRFMPTLYRTTVQSELRSLVQRRLFV